MTAAFKTGPRIVHETSRRIRFRWNRLLDPGLEPDYLQAWLENLPGVESVRVNPMGRTLAAEYDGTPAGRDALISGLREVPEEAFLRRDPAPPRRRIADAAFHGAAASAVPFLPRVVQGVAASAMGLPVVLRGLDTLVNRGLKAPVLDMTTVGASLFRADFTSAATISAMVVVGDYLRRMTDDKSNALLKSLMSDPVDHVRVERGGASMETTFEKVRVGDTVLCTGGELVPVDGVVERGEALLDTGSVTGEAAPVLVRAGDSVISGSTVVEGSLGISAERTGADTDMARIASFMTKALSEKSETELKSDRLADALTPLTLGLGAGLYALTRDWERALSVLTVDFACAVKFPSPVVIKTSMYTAGKQGILVKSGRGLEALADVDAVVFDKTGTLTAGVLSVTDVVLCDAPDGDTFFRIAASVEDRHGHPVGRAVVGEAARRNLDVPAAVEMDLSIAHGVSGMVDGRKVRVGSRHFIEDDCGVDCSTVAEQAAELRTQGKSLVYVAEDARLQGIAALRDTVRPEAGHVVAALRESGIKKIVMLTGDHEATTAALAGEFSGLDEIRAGLLPEDKALVVRELQEAGYTVAVVGDGVNDAPAFTAADVGICMSRSTGAARQSAQIVLDEDSLEGVVAVRDIALRASRILQNCFNAGVSVNLGLLAAAGAGLLRPATAALIHNLNTFAVLGSAAWASSRILPKEHVEKEADSAQ